MKRILLLVACVTVLYATEIHAQWVQCNGPYGNGNIENLATSGSELFTVARGGVYVSSDSGATWNVSKGVPGVYTLVASGTTILAGTDSGLYTSVNDGASWSKSTLPPSPAGVFAVAASGPVIFAARYGELYRSTNSGANWTLVDTTIKSIQSLVVVGSEVFAGSYNGLYHSSDDGDTWSKSPLNVYDVYSLAVRGTNVYAGTNAGLFASFDHGAAWVHLGSNYVFSIALAAEDIYVGTAHGLFRTDDSGRYWTPFALPNNHQQEYDVNAIALLGNTIVAGTGNIGVIRSTDNGNEWKESNTGIPTTSVRSLAQQGTNLFATVYSAGVFRSTDRGQSWNLTDSSVSPYVESLARQGEKLFAAGYQGLFVTTDEGKVWMKTGAPDSTNGYTGITTDDIHSIDAFGSGLFCNTYHGVFRSTNNGASWVFAGLRDQDAGSFIEFGGNVYVSGYPFRRFISDTTWETVSAPPRYLGPMFVSGTNLFAEAQDSGVVLSTDNGITWMQRNNGLVLMSNDSNLKSNVNCFAASGNRVFVGTFGGVSMTTDNGANWFDVSGGMGVRPVESLIVSGDTLFAGTWGGGVWQTKISEITALSAVETNIPLAFSTSIFPNPFTTSSTIHFTLPKLVYVTLNVFDAEGREVTRIASGAMDAGEHVVPFERGSLLPGVYFYRLSAGGESQVHAMVIAE